jgi:hypothetical protein
MILNKSFTTRDRVASEAVAPDVVAAMDNVEVDVDGEMAAVVVGAVVVSGDVADPTALLLSPQSPNSCHS